MTSRIKMYRWMRDINTVWLEQVRQKESGLLHGRELSFHRKSKANVFHIQHNMPSSRPDHDICNYDQIYIYKTILSQRNENNMNKLKYFKKNEWILTICIRQFIIDTCASELTVDLKKIKRNKTLSNRQNIGNILKIGGWN